METLDVKGLSCPLPVIKTKKKLETGVQELQVIGTGNTAKQNVTKFAKSQGLNVETVNEDDGEWALLLVKGE